ncbi:c-type cytochrome [Chloroflexota bacterium]
MKLSSSSPKSKKEIYKEEYEATKKGGESFFPETLARDAVVALLVVGAIVALAIISPAQTEPPADPTSTTYNPRPEWYFLFFFQFLKFFPGSMEAIAAVVIPILAISILILIPLLDRNHERRLKKRKMTVGIGIIVILLFGYLEITGAATAPAIPAGEESLRVQQGREIYREINCSYCHSIGGIGGNIGPELGEVGRDLTEEQMAAYLQNPHAMVPSTLHPKLLFTEEEMEALVSYLTTLGAQYSYSEQAPELYQKECSSCHILNGQGGTIGPDLTGIGDRRTINFLEGFTSNPGSVLPGASMPAYSNKLTPEQIRDIAAYLYSQQSEAASETPQSELPPVLEAPLIPHPTEGRDDCLLCHGEGRVQPYSQDHIGRTNETCTICHKPS